VLKEDHSIELEKDRRSDEGEPQSGICLRRRAWWTPSPSRCKEVESGARNVDHILTGSMLPALSGEVLQRMAEGLPVRKVQVGVDAAGAFTYRID